MDFVENTTNWLYYSDKSPCAWRISSKIQASNFALRRWCTNNKAMSQLSFDNLPHHLPILHHKLLADVAVHDEVQGRVLLGAPREHTTNSRVVCASWWDVNAQDSMLKSVPDIIHSAVRDREHDLKTRILMLQSPSQFPWQYCLLPSRSWSSPCPQRAWSLSEPCSASMRFHSAYHAWILHCQSTPSCWILIGKHGGEGVINVHLLKLQGLNKHVTGVFHDKKVNFRDDLAAEMTKSLKLSTFLNWHSLTLIFCSSIIHLCKSRDLGQEDYEFSESPIGKSHRSNTFLPFSTWT